MVILAISAVVDFTSPKSARLAGSCSPTAPSKWSRFRPSREDRLRRFLDRGCLRKISHCGR